MHKAVVEVHPEQRRPGARLLHHRRVHAALDGGQRVRARRVVERRRQLRRRHRGHRRRHQKGEARSRGSHGAYALLYLSVATLLLLLA